MSIKRRKLYMQRVDTSKMILRCLLLVLSILLPFVITLAFLGIVEPLVRYIEGTFALTTISVGFYYWKAKAENLHKYKQDAHITMNGENNYD